MKRSKNQAVFKFLPGMWISSNLPSGEPITAQLTVWNPMPVHDIFDNFINNEIKRQIQLFGSRGGDIGAFDTTEDSVPFKIVEPACAVDIPDIRGKISPLVFYCGTCGKMFQKNDPKNVNRYTWTCQSCGKTVKQLQMIFACECGFAEEIKLPRLSGVEEYIYRPNEPQGAYKLYYKRNGKIEIYEFVKPCPICGKRLYPDNATAGRNFKPFSLPIINLIDNRAGRFYSKGSDAQKIVVARWFGKINNEEFDKILENVDAAFNANEQSNARRDKAEEQVRSLISMGIVKEEMFEFAVQNMLQNSLKSEYKVEDCLNFYHQELSSFASDEWLSSYSFKLMQYDTLKYAKRLIPLDMAIQHQVNMEFVDNPGDVVALNRKMGIMNAQLSHDIQILNCTYGYTRRASDPKVAQSSNKNCRLKLNAFDKTNDGRQNYVYAARLETEGILFEIDQRKIIEWLFKNRVISEAQLPDLEDTVSVKKWFAEYVHSDKITMFGEIDPSEQITKHVFSLLHSMSHCFIKTAGEMSGLSGNSLSEIIIAETASIFIYAQSSQGVPLGALSGLFESSYYSYMQNVFANNRNCIFDPICTDRDDTSCSACIQLPDVTCHYFNTCLGRKYLYTMHNEENLLGFWEC